MIQLLFVLLSGDDIGVLLPFIIVLFLFVALAMKRSTKSNRETKATTEIDLKVRYQPFILAVKGMFPNAKILYMNDETIVMEDKLDNPLKKSIGKIRLRYMRAGIGSINEKTTLLYSVDAEVEFSFGGSKRTYNAHKQIKNSNCAEVIKEVYNQVMENQDLNKRILATTY